MIENEEEENLRAIQSESSMSQIASKNNQEDIDIKGKKQKGK